jgi:hypothetical protein
MAGDGIAKIQVPTAPVAHRTLEPRTADARHRFVPHHEDRVPVEQKIGSAWRTGSRSAVDAQGSTGVIAEAGAEKVRATRKPKVFIRTSLATLPRCAG